MSEEPADNFDQIVAPAYTSPLHEVALEAHEIYAELLSVGFPIRAADRILAFMLYDIMTDRSFEDDEDDDEDEIDEEDKTEDDGSN
jgi:hypothetical protein